MAERNNALARDPEVAFRASMLPIGNYEDGSVAFPVWPQSAVDAGNALMRFHRGEAPQPQDAVLAGLLMSGTGFGALAGRGVRAVSGRALEGAEASRPLASSPVEAGSAAQTVSPQPPSHLPMDPAARAARAREMGFDPDTTWYHATPTAGFDEFDISPARRAAANNGFEGVSVAPYADNSYAGTNSGPSPGVYPLNLRVKKPFVWNEDRPVRSANRVRKVMPEFYDEGDFIVEQREALSRALREAGYDALDVMSGGRLEERTVFDPKNIRSVNAAFDPAKSDSANILAANPKEAAPAGILATSGLDRLKAEEAAKPRAIPDAPQSFPELESYVDRNFENGSGNRVIAARDQNPQRYWDYANGLHDVLNPESEWMMGGPTLQSGGGGAAAGAVPQGDRGQMPDFDSALADFHSFMVDLNGDGKPDAVVRSPMQDMPVPQRLVPRANALSPGFDMLPAEAPQAPMNALAGGSGAPRGNALSPPATPADRAADAMMPQSAPLYPPPASPYRFPSPASASNPLQWLGGAVQDIADDPLGAVTGAGEWNPMAGTAARVAPYAGEAGAIGNALMRGPRRAFTEAESDTFRAARRKSDIDISRAAPHEIQTRNAQGHFQPFTEAQRTERERGVAARARDQRAAEAAERRAAEEAERQAKLRARWQSPEFQAQRQRDIDFLSRGGEPEIRMPEAQLKKMKSKMWW